MLTTQVYDMDVGWPEFLTQGRGSRGYIDGTVCTQVLPPVVSFLRTHLTRVKLQVTRWRLYIVLDLMPMHARYFNPSWGLLHTPGMGTRKKRKCSPHQCMAPNT